MSTASFFPDEICVASSPLYLWMYRWFCFQHGIQYDSAHPIQIQPLAEDVRRFLEQDGLEKEERKEVCNLVLPAVFRYLSAATSSCTLSPSLASLVEEARVQLYQDVSTQRFQKTLHTGWPATMADAYRLHTQLRLRFSLRQPNDDQEEREEGEVEEGKEDNEPLLLRKVYAALSTSFDPTFVRRFLQHGYGLPVAHVAGMAYVQGLSYRPPGFQRELFSLFLRDHTTGMSNTETLTKDEVIDLFRFFLMQHDYAPFAVSPERYLEWFYLMQHDYLKSSNLELLQDNNKIFVNEAGLALWHAYRRTCQRELYRNEPNEEVVETRKRSLEERQDEQEEQVHEEAHTSQEEHEEGDDDDEEEDGEEQEQVHNNVYDATTYLQNDRRGRRGIFTKEEDALLLSLRHQRLAYKEIRAHPLLSKFSIKQLSNRGYKRIRDDVDAPIQRKPKRARVLQNDVQTVPENNVPENNVPENNALDDMAVKLARLYCDDHGLGKTLWRIRRMLQQRNDIWEPDSASLLQERVLNPIDDASWHNVVCVVAQLCAICAGDQAHLLFVHGLVLVAVDELLQQQPSTLTFAQLCANVGPRLASFDFEIERVRQHAAERILVHGLLTRLGGHLESTC